MTKLELAIDAVVETYDPDARRRLHEAARNRDVQLGKPDDDTGTASLWGRLYATDAALLKRRLAEMIRDVCPADPRTLGQRRADALGALAAGADRLSCQCDSAQCPSAGQDDPRAAALVIHAITDTAPANTKATADTVPAETNTDARAETTAGAGRSGDAGTDTARPDAPTPASPPDAPAPVSPSTSTAALILGGGVIPGPLLAQLIATGATVRNTHAPDTATAQPGYRPSAPVDRFVRMRDMTCRFPGCDRPAECCDVDHTTPYPGGATHPSNLKCLCRFHHLLKIFCGWRDEQRPDGTVHWTAPSGRTYITRPFSRVVFPAWDTTTADLPPPSNAPPATVQRGLKMPRRRRSRAAENAARIKAERALNKSAR